MIETTHEILDVLGVASKENQKILAPLFLEFPDIRRIQQEFTNLYNIQTQRANFSKWDAVLEHFSKIAENTELSSEIKSLRMRLSEIKEKFYTDNNDFDIPGVNPHSWKYYTKVGLITAFRDKSLSPDQLQYLAKSYISHLRITIEYIGKSIGKIDVMVDK